MGQQEAHGKREKLKGRVKEAAGIITGDSALERKGARQRAGGAAEEGLGRARRKVGEFIAGTAKAARD